MKFLKNPLVAVLIAVVIISSSTFISAKLKLEAECQEITDGFYKGVEYDGYKHRSIYSQLDALSGAVSGIKTLADKYGVDSTELNGINGELKSSLSSMHNRISSIYRLYSALTDSLRSVLDLLSDKELSNRDAKGLENYIATVTSVEKAISESGYNESVRNNINKMTGLRAFFIEITDTELPEMFS